MIGRGRGIGASVSPLCVVYATVLEKLVARRSVRISGMRCAYFGGRGTWSGIDGCFICFGGNVLPADDCGGASGAWGGGDLAAKSFLWMDGGGVGRDAALATPVLCGVCGRGSLSVRAQVPLRLGAGRPDTWVEKQIPRSAGNDNQCGRVSRSAGGKGLNVAVSRPVYQGIVLPRWM